MPEINLKDHYPDAHQQDCFIEVTQEIFEVMHEMVRRESAFAPSVSLSCTALLGQSLCSI